MNDNNTVVDLQARRNSLSTSTSSTTDLNERELPSSSSGTNRVTPPPPTNTSPPPPDNPSWFTFENAVWAVIGFIIIWLGVLSKLALSESKEISGKINSNHSIMTEKVNNNHTETIKLINANQKETRDILHNLELKFNNQISSSRKETIEEIEKQENKINQLQNQLHDNSK